MGYQYMLNLNFNSEKYQELLAEYQPKLIRTEAENKLALISIEKLIHLSNRSPEQDAIYALLIILVMMVHGWRDIRG